MRSWILAAGAAALAMTAPALADPNKGGGKGQGGGNQGQKQQAKADRGGGNSARGDGQAMRQGKPDRVERQANIRPDRGRDDTPRNARVEHRGAEKVRVAKANEGKGNQRRAVVVDNEGDAVRIVRRDFNGDAFFRGARVPFGCPPGLDRKDNGCLPPGQAKKLLGAPLVAAFADDRIPFQYRNWYPDNDDFYYRNGDGFIYRVNRSNDLVDGLIPLFGGGGYYAMGDPWPQPYNFYNVPMQYQSYWPNGSDYSYRYGDGAIYRLDPATNLVSGIVALLAGDLGVGSRLPLGYDVYNVPMAYRAQYYDTPDAWYRYNDGYIYRVDPTTRMITAVIDAIV
jgi:hypothetical protein